MSSGSPVRTRLLAAVLPALLLLTACGGRTPVSSAPPSDGAAASSTPAPAVSAGEASGAGPAASGPAGSSAASSAASPSEEEEELVEELLAEMTLEEKVGQLFFVRCPADRASEDVTASHLGGYLLFTRDFQDAAGNWLTAEAFRAKIASWQEAAAIPLLIGVDEEGGAVVRASRNPNLFPLGKCRSPQWLASHAHDHGDVFAEDAWEKNSTLTAYGINVNLAPVCDVSTDKRAFMYDRTLGKGAEETADYVERVVTAMSDSGIGSVLKHFPGYGNNADTHTGVVVDGRPMEEFVSSDFLPFRAGIAAGGDKTAVLVSHNIVACMDGELPASLSPAVHRILREELGFDGVAMTDDLAMDAVTAYAKDGAAAVMALEAGNDLIITTDYRTQIPKVVEAVQSGTLDEAAVDAACRRVLRGKAALLLFLKEK